MKFKMVTDELLNLAPNVQLRKVLHFAIITIDRLSVQLMHSKLLLFLDEPFLIKNVGYIMGELGTVQA